MHGKRVSEHTTLTRTSTHMHKHSHAHTLACTRACCCSRHCCCSCCHRCRCCSSSIMPGFFTHAHTHMHTHSCLQTLVCNPNSWHPPFCAQLLHRSIVRGLHVHEVAKNKNSRWRWRAAARCATNDGLSGPGGCRGRAVQNLERPGAHGWAS